MMKAYPKLIDVKPLDQYRLLLKYKNDEQRLYDFKPNLGHQFFQNLHDVELFNAVSVSNGELEWETGQDFCPHTLYENSRIIDTNSR